MSGDDAIFRFSAAIPEAASCCFGSFGRVDEDGPATGDAGQSLFESSLRILKQSLKVFIRGTWKESKIIVPVAPGRGDRLVIEGVFDKSALEDDVGSQVKNPGGFFK